MHVCVPVRQFNTEPSAMSGTWKRVWLCACVCALVCVLCVCIKACVWKVRVCQGEQKTVSDPCLWERETIKG